MRQSRKGNEKRLRSAVILISTIYPSCAATQLLRYIALNLEEVALRREHCIQANLLWIVFCESVCFSRASDGCKAERTLAMNFHTGIVLVSLIGVLTALVPGSALATSKSSGHGRRSQTYHDRTPTVHSRGSHSHHG